MSSPPHASRASTTWTSVSSNRHRPTPWWSARSSRCATPPEPPPCSADRSERLAELATGRPPRVWGAHEPAGNRWDREQLTEFARIQMPGPILALAAAARLLGHDARCSAPARDWRRSPRPSSVSVYPAPSPSRTSGNGCSATWPSWPATGDAAGRAAARPARAERPAGAAAAPHPPSPLALLVGPPGVRGLEVDVPRHGRAVRGGPGGRPRIPGLLFDLGTARRADLVPARRDHRPRSAPTRSRESARAEPATHSTPRQRTDGR